ncbi:CRISPR system precrRNA processing endoribonuclease RAMP protein Cas6 [Campylobacter concisus]
MAFQARRWINLRLNLSVSSKKLSFYDLERYSNRQHTKMQFGGVIGKMRVYGLDERSAGLLQLATITGVGKSTVFGLGKIDVTQI